MNLIAILILSVTIRYELAIEDWGDPSSQGYTAKLHVNYIVNYIVNSEWTGVGAWSAELLLEEGDFAQVWLTCHGVAEYHLTAFNLETAEMVANSWLPGDDYMEWIAGEEEPEPPVIPGGGGGGCGCGVNAVGAIAVFVAGMLMLWLFLRKAT